jgi:hypothetical protein
MRIVGIGMAIGLLVCTTLGCATSFTGSPHIEGGRNGCEAKCRGQGMQISGMVYMGEYSSACVCEVPRTTGSSGDRTLLGSAGGVSGGAVGVIMQMRRQQEQQQHQMMMH